MLEEADEGFELQGKAKKKKLKKRVEDAFNHFAV